MQSVENIAAYSPLLPFSTTFPDTRDHAQQWGREGARWIAFATRRGIDDVMALGLTPRQIETLGRWLAENRLLNPPALVPMKTGEFTCACCGEKFTAQYRTKRPKYKDKAHKARAYRARRRDRELAAIEAQRPRAVALQRAGNGFKVVHE
jgi:hypothetical protein